MPQSYSFTHTNRIAIYLVLKPALVLVVLILFTYADFVECCLNQKILQIFPITLLASDFLKIGSLNTENEACVDQESLFLHVNKPHYINYWLG